MWKLVFASLALACTAYAQPAAKCPEAKGTPLVQIDHDVRAGSKGATSSLKVYDGGAWSQTGADETGKATPPQSGCLDKSTMTKLHADVKGAPWTLTHKKVHCMMVSSTFTVFSLNGKEVFKELACNPDALDDASAKNLTDLQAVLVAAHVPVK